MDKPFAAYDGPDPYVFVCYAHADAGRVYPELERLHAAGINLWYDEGISAGHEWTQDLADAIAGCARLLYFVSPASVATQNCRNEVQFSLDRGKPLVAVHLEKTDLPDGLQLAIGLQQALLRHDLTDAVYFDKLCAALRGNDERVWRVAGRKRRWPAVAAAAVLLIAVAAAGMFAWPPRSDPAAHAAYVAALDYQRQGRAGAALALENFQKVLALDSEHARAWAGVCDVEGTWSRDDDRLKRAEAACLNAARIDGEAWEVRVALGNLMRHRNNLDGALDELAQAQRQAPEQPRVHAAIGAVYHRQMDLERAAEAYEHARALEPGFWRWQAMIGDVHYSASRYALAAEHYERALALSPPDAVPVLNSRATTLFLLDRFDEAEAAWRTALAIQPSGPAHEGLGSMYYYRGCPNHAARESRAMIALRPGWPKAWADTGAHCALVADGEVVARTAYQRAIELLNATGFTTPSTLGRLAEAYVQVGAPALARRTLERLHATGTTAQTWYWDAIVHYRLGDKTTAEAARKRAIELGFTESLFTRDPSLVPFTCDLPEIAPQCDSLAGLPL